MCCSLQGSGGTATTTPASSGALLPCSSSTSTLVSSYSTGGSLPGPYYHPAPAPLAPNPALQPALNPMYALSGLNGLSGATNAGLAAQGLGNSLSGNHHLLGGAGLVNMAGAAPGHGLYDPAAMGAMGALALPKDPIARSTMLAQIAAEKAVLTNRKRKLIDTMV